ncbi:MAG: hypothetical protein KF723_05280 [Rhizobiaceae bacterium]|nr:hypothetical protein [Rhizobiaceae bacterium]
MAPDILIHERGVHNDWICFEMKPARNANLARDSQKLTGLTHPDLGFDYDFGMLLVFDAPAPQLHRIEVYARGAVSDEATQLSTRIARGLRILAR